MGNKIADCFIEKVSVPMVCRIADQKFKFENDAEDKISSYQAEEKWAEQYKKDFGTEPSFF